MRVHIEVHGHQKFESIDGEVLQWTSTAESFDGEWIQVPCVVIDDGEIIRCVALKTQYTVTTVRKSI